MKKQSFSFISNLPVYLAGSFIFIAASCHDGSSGKEKLSPKKSDSAVLAQKRIDSARKALYINNDLSILFLDATSQIMQAQMALEKADAGNKKAGIPDSVIVNSPKGDTLFLTLYRVYDAGALFAETDEQKIKFEEMKQPDSNKLWLAKYFKGKNVDAALSQLEKFQNDCNVINKIVHH